MQVGAFVCAAVAFSYTGTMAPWSVPPFITSFRVDAIGAAGSATNGFPGLGGYIAVNNISAAPFLGSTIYVNVGGYVDGNSGGGSTDLRTSSTSLSSRIIVAGGGGTSSGQGSIGQAGVSYVGTSSNTQFFNILANIQGYALPNGDGNGVVYITHTSCIPGYYLLDGVLCVHSPTPVPTPAPTPQPTFMLANKRMTTYTSGYLLSMHYKGKHCKGTVVSSEKTSLDTCRPSTDDTNVWVRFAVKVGINVNAKSISKLSVPYSDSSCTTYLASSSGSPLRGHKVKHFADGCEDVPDAFGGGSNAYSYVPNAPTPAPTTAAPTALPTSAPTSGTGTTYFYISEYGPLDTSCAGAMAQTSIFPSGMCFLKNDGTSYSDVFTKPTPTTVQYTTNTYASSDCSGAISTSTINGGTTFPLDTCMPFGINLYYKFGVSSVLPTMNTGSAGVVRTHFRTAAECAAGWPFTKKDIQNDGVCVGLGLSVGGGLAVAESFGSCTASNGGSFYYAAYTDLACTNKITTAPDANGRQSGTNSFSSWTCHQNGNSLDNKDSYETRACA